MKRSFSFTAKVWLYPGNAAWHFVTLPADVASDINYYFAHAKRGWGSLPVVATIGTTTWKTSIFPDKQSQSFVLPLKAAVRKSEQLVQGGSVSCTVQITA